MRMPWTHLQRGPQSDRHLTRWVFLRLLGVIYLIAFVSLWTQIHGLIGEQGLLPAETFLQAVRQQVGTECYWFLPTLGWIGASDLTLHLLCAVGAVSAALLIVDLAPALLLAVLWADYLSLTLLGQVFLSFQWDILLLETGFLAIFFAPIRLLPRRPADDPAPSRLMVWWLWWLLFRLMVSSGLVKLASGDPAWRDLTALTVHYETQPLPTWIGWYAHQLPDWFHRVSCAVMFGIELAVPLLIFTPRRARIIGTWILIGFQVLIAATGNYTFFNLLTIALCILQVDDRVWPAWLRRWARAGQPGTPRVRGAWPGWIIVTLSLLLALLTIVPMAHLSRGRLSVPRPLLWLSQRLEPWNLVNQYGLFAVMTSSRHEIVVEGSHDGIIWRAYEFPSKPGDPARPPAFVAPHQPRLDWQMWFAALGSYEQHPWFLRFCQRLLEGSPSVLALLARNPFPESPPRYLRAVVYNYRFTDLAIQRATGAWWRRERLGLYCPVLSLQQTGSDPM